MDEDRKVSKLIQRIAERMFYANQNCVPKDGYRMIVSFTPNVDMAPYWDSPEWWVEYRKDPGPIGLIWNKSSAPTEAEVPESPAETDAESGSWRDRPPML